MNHVPRPRRSAGQNMWRSFAVCVAVMTAFVSVGGCDGAASSDNPDCDFVNSEATPMLMEQNIPHDLGGRTYVAGNIGSVEIEGETALAVEMVETGPDIELTKTDVRNCGDYEMAGVPVQIRVLETSIEVWPVDGIPIYTGPATTVG